ncbi:MAG: glycoside hydrolase family 127 protein, partial [Planctomycetes bacterium]|nr:glycoside hydrolase family 127 protein [Planctomycetota bacterium]
YTDVGPETGHWSVSVDGETVAPEFDAGYVVLRRDWKRGDVVDLHLDMPVRRVRSHPNVEANRGRVALERGPLVYCVEAIDHGGRVAQLSLPEGASIVAERRPDLLGGIVALTTTGLASRISADGMVETKPTPITAVPYHLWAHRELGEMTVWLPDDPVRARPTPLPTIASTSRASASHVWTTDSVEALNDQVEPVSSGDASIPRFTWWDRRGTTEWVQYDFRETTEVSTVDVYWFDDTGRGSCRVPASWRLYYLDRGTWRPVSAQGEFDTTKDHDVTVHFTPVSTQALRIEVDLRDGMSGGILEWKVR